MTSRSLALLALSTAFAVVACGQVTPSLPVDGLSSEQSTAMAQPMAQSMSSTPVEFLSQKTGQYRDFSGGGQITDASRWVWSVVFNGTFHQAGGPAGASPLPDQHSVLLIIDYRSGKFIQALVPAPYVPD